MDAPEGAIVLCRPEAEDFFRWDPESRTRHGFFHFQIEQFPGDLPPPTEWPLVHNPPEGDIVRPLFRYLLTGMGKGPDLPHRLALAQMVAAFVTGDLAGDDVPGAVWPEAVERAWAFIQTTLEEDPDKHITLASLAAVACVTREHLCRLFKEATGHSPMETVRRARLDRAVVLLARSNYSIGEIAALCGYSDPFLLTRRFTQAFGQAPTEMRRALRAGATPPVPLLSAVHRRSH